jgi:hypothetical protein
MPRGVPLNKGSNARSPRLEIVLPEGAKELVQEAAKQAGETVSGFSRGAILDSVGYVPEPAPVQPPKVKRMHANAAKTACKYGHLFSEANTGRCGGRRYCKKCKRDASQRARDRKK